MELPFLVVHGGWLWPVVGVVLVAGVAWGVHRRVRRRATTVIDNPLARSMQARRFFSAIPAPVLAAVVTGFVYYFALLWIGDALVTDEIDGYEPSGDPDVASRLAWGAATPERETALKQLYIELAPRTRQPGVLAARMEILRILGDRCERIVYVLSLASQHEAAIAEAKQCEPSVELFETVAESNLALARFADAATALARAHEVSGGKRPWTADDLAVLVMARDWKRLADVASKLAAAAAGSPSGDVRECLALIARHRGGDPKALAELRARPLAGGKAICRLFAADATGALEDLQVLTAFPLEPADLAAGAEPLPATGDVAAAYRRFLAETSGTVPPAPPYTLAPSQVPADVGADLRGPASWRGEGDGQPDDLEALRMLVLATHAPGEPLNLVYPRLDGELDQDIFFGSMGADGSLGMRVRALRALWPHRAKGKDTADAIVPLLYSAADARLRIGDQVRADALLVAAIDLQRSLQLAPYAQHDAHEDASLATIVSLLRRGDHATAAAIHAEVGRTKIADRKIDTRYLVAELIAAARGDLHAIQKLAPLNIEKQTPAIEQALAGDGRGLASLPFEGVGNLRRAMPFLFRYVKDPAPLVTLVRTWSALERTPWGWIEELGMQLHLAEAARDEVTVRSLRERARAYYEAMTAADTALILGVVDALR